MVEKLTNTVEVTKVGDKYKAVVTEVDGKTHESATHEYEVLKINGKYMVDGLFIDRDTAKPMAFKDKDGKVTDIDTAVKQAIADGRVTNVKPDLVLVAPAPDVPALNDGGKPALDVSALNDGGKPALDVPALNDGGKPDVVLVETAESKAVELNMTSAAASAAVPHVGKHDAVAAAGAANPIEAAADRVIDNVVQIIGAENARVAADAILAAAGKDHQAEKPDVVAPAPDVPALNDGGKPALDVPALNDGGEPALDVPALNDGGSLTWCWLKQQRVKLWN